MRSSRARFFSFCGSLLMLPASFALAVPALIVNHSFEDDVVASPTDIANGVPNGWSAYEAAPMGGEFYGSLHAAPDNYPAGAPEGNNVAVCFQYANNASDIAFGIEQLLVETLDASMRYSLTVDVGNIASGFNDLPGTPGNPGDDTFFDIDGYNGYQLALLVDVGGSYELLAADNDTRPMADGVFETRTVVFDGVDAAPHQLGQPLVIRLLTLNRVDPAEVGSDRETNFDNVRLDVSPSPQTVPLPVGSLASLALLLTAIAIYRARSHIHPA